jgi:hypothetical protein
MPKATRVHSTPRRTASLRKTAPPARPIVDPIFAAIENHKKLNRAWHDLCPVLEAAELDEEGYGPRPAADLTALRRNEDHAHVAAEEAAWKMARTKPTTVAGASAMLSFIATNPTNGLFELGETRWHETAFRTVTAALAKITRQVA